MNITNAREEVEYIIRGINTDDDELNAFLFTLGCYAGEPVTLVSHRQAINNRKKEIRRLRKHIFQAIGRCAYFQIFSECFLVVFKYYLIRLIQRHRDHQAQTHSQERKHHEKKDRSTLCCKSFGTHC